jgi:hypothetical protein
MKIVLLLQGAAGVKAFNEKDQGKARSMPGLHAAALCPDHRFLDRTTEIN